MTTVDLSLSLREGMPQFPGYPGYETTRLQTHEKEGKVSHHIGMNTHHGTHVDAPAHFVPDGATIDEAPPSLLWGDARIVDLRAHRGTTITADDLSAAAPDLDADRVVLLTGDVDARFEDGNFFEEAAVLTEGAADWIVDRGVDLLANDFLTESVADFSRPVHETLLGDGVYVVEYLHNVATIVDKQRTRLAVCPLKLDGLEAAPARVLARP